MLKLTMIRHGKTFGNTQGRYIGVTDESLLPSETEDLGQYGLQDVDAVFSSPLKRCVETANILYPGKEPILVPDLRECDFGKFENKNYQELSGDPDYQAWIDSGGTIAFPGGESRTKFQKRCVRGVAEVIRMAIEQEWQDVALVIHGGTIMAVLDQYGIPKADYFSWQVKNGEGFMVRVNQESFLAGRGRLVVSGKIVRDPARPEGMKIERQFHIEFVSQNAEEAEESSQSYSGIGSESAAESSHGYSGIYSGSGLENAAESSQGYAGTGPENSENRDTMKAGADHVR